MASLSCILPVEVRADAKTDCGSRRLRRSRWTAPVRLGDYVTIGLGTVVGIGVDAGARCQVGALRLIPKFSRLKPDTTYVGTPVRELRRSEERSIDVHPLDGESM